MAPNTFAKESTNKRPKGGEGYVERLFDLNWVKVQSCPAKVDRIASLSSTHPHEVLRKNMTGDKPCHPPAGVTAAPKT